MAIKPAGQEFLVNSRTERDQWNPAIAADANGNFVITWQSSIFSNLSQRFLADGTRQGGEIQGKTGSFLPDIAMAANGNFAIAQTLQIDPFFTTLPDIYLSNFSATGLTRGADIINKTRVGSQDYAAIAMRPAGEAIVVWESYSPSTSQTTIHAQFIEANGKPVGREIRVFSTGDETGDADVAFDAQGNFIVTWEKTHEGIYARRYDRDTNPIDATAFPVNAIPRDGEHNHPVVAAAANGNFVIAWQSEYGDDDGYGILARQFRADGTPIGGEIAVNTFTQGQQDEPAIAMDSTGNFVITWESDEQDGSREGVYARRFAADGRPLGQEFLVSTTTIDDQYAPDIAMQPNGDFVITWTSDMQDGDGKGVYARRFQRVATVEFANPTVAVAENGQVVGSEIKLVRRDEIDLLSEVGIQVTGGSATNGTDYSLNSSLIVTFAPGETEKTIAIPILQDTLNEGAETVQLSVNAGDRAVIGSQSTSVLTILDDDTSPSPNTPNISGTPNVPGIPTSTGTQLTITGNARAEKLLGTAADEILVGFQGNDSVQGGGGADMLIGVNPYVRKPGVRERDTLSGNEGADGFVLGNAQAVFYDDGKRVSAGLQDYALIKDFNAASDSIQLHGRRSSYRLGTAPQGLPKGIGIFLETGKTDELIAVVQGQRNLRLTNPAFQFVK